MNTPGPLRALWIALFAALHLALQPIAASMPCELLGGGSGDCCCTAKVESEAALPCCSDPQEPSPEPADEDGCDCTAAPDPAPTTPEAGPELPRSCVAFVAHPAPTLSLFGRGLECTRRARARAPGDPPSLLLLHQVFLL